MQGTGSGDSARQAGSVYQGFRGRRSGAMIGEINVTPLVDVVLVLLLVFMVTAPMMSRGIDVSLPVANLPDKQPEDRITVTVTRRRADHDRRPAREHRAPRGPDARPDGGPHRRTSSTCAPTRACATAR